MSFVEGVFIYLLCWWLSLFAVLPWRVKTQDPKSAQRGNDLGAPQTPLLLQKFVATCLVAGVLTVAIWLAIPADVGERGGIIAVMVGAG